MTFQARIEAAPPLRRAAPALAPATRRQLLLIIIAASLAGAIVRLWDIGARSLWLDEAYSGWFSALSWRQLWFETPQYETHPPLYYSLLKLWRFAAGGDAAGLRGLSAIAGIATIPVVALAAHELSRLLRAPRPLLLVAAAAALAALSPRLYVIGQDARPYAVLTFAYAVAIYGWLRLTRSFRQGNGAGSCADWTLLAAGTLATLWLHGIGILYGAALFGALLLSAAPEPPALRWRRLAITVAAVTVLYLPCLAILARRSDDWSNGWLRWKPAKFPSDMLELYGLHHLDEMVTPVLALLAMPPLLFLGVRMVARRASPGLAASLVLLLLAPPLAAGLISQLGTPVFLLRTQVAVLIPAYLLVACAISQTERAVPHIAGAALALLFAVNLAQAVARPDLEPWREVASVLKREMRPGDVIWVYPNDVKLPLERSLGSADPIVSIPAPYPAIQASGLHPTGSPAVVAIEAEQARGWARRHAPAPGATVWLLRGATAYFDPDATVLDALAEGRRQDRARQWSEIDLDLRALRPAAAR